MEKRALSAIFRPSLSFGGRVYAYEKTLNYPN